MIEVFINNTKVDLAEDASIPLNFAIADITDPDKRNTSFSKTIKLAGSKINNQLLTFIFEIGKDSQLSGNVNFSPDFNASLAADCKIFWNNILQFSGVMQLLEIVKQGDNIEYQCVVFGRLKNIFLNIEGKKLEDLDLSEYDHLWNRTEMKLTWDTRIKKNGSNYVNFSAGNPTGEGYVYPTIDYGYTQNINKILITKSFPAVYVREYMTKIFELAGFTWNSTFFDSNFFKRLIIPYNGSTPSLSLEERERRRFEVERTTTQGLNPVYVPANPNATYVSETINEFNSEVTDNWPAFSTPYWTVPQKGKYSLSATVSGTISTNFANPSTTDARVYVRISKMNIYGTVTILAVQSQYVGSLNDLSPQPYSITTTIGSIKLDKGDRLFVSTVLQGGAKSVAVGYFGTVTSASFENASLSAPVQIGEDMLLNAMIPRDVLIKDFFMSIIRMFNLYVQPDPDNENQLNIEPLIDFYTNNESIDWTNKIDYSKDVLINPVSNIEGKNYNFRYKPDNDYYNSLYRRTYQSEYGERTIEVLNDFANNTKKIELIFSPTPSVGNTQNSMVIPRIVSQDEETLAIEPYESNIRILYYGGVKSSGGSWNWPFTSAGTSLETTYAYAGHLDDPYNPTFDLLFDIPLEIFWGAQGDIGSNYTTKNLFTYYWGQFITEITDKDSKKVTFYVKLTPLDIFNLDFRDTIYIDGIAYRLNKIIDYDPTKEETYKVELLKLKRANTFVPSVDDVISSQDPLKFDVIEGGLDEVRSLTPITDIIIIDGGEDVVSGLDNEISIVNGGLN